MFCYLLQLDLCQHKYLICEITFTFKNKILLVYFFQDEPGNRDYLCSTIASTSDESDENAPLVDRSMMDRKRCYPLVPLGWPRESWSSSLPQTITGTRLAVFVTVSVVMCLVACIAILHPYSSGKIAVSIRRCLFGYRFP